MDSVINPPGLTLKPASQRGLRVQTTYCRGPGTLEFETCTRGAKGRTGTTVRENYWEREGAYVGKKDRTLTLGNSSVYVYGATRNRERVPLLPETRCWARGQGAWNRDHSLDLKPTSCQTPTCSPPPRVQVHVHLPCPECPVCQGLSVHAILIFEE